MRCEQGEHAAVTLPNEVCAVSAVLLVGRPLQNVSVRLNSQIGVQLPKAPGVRFVRAVVRSLDPAFWISGYLGSVVSLICPASTCACAPVTWFGREKGDGVNNCLFFRESYLHVS